MEESDHLAKGERAALLSFCWKRDTGREGGRRGRAKSGAPPILSPKPPQLCWRGCHGDHPRIKQSRGIWWGLKPQESGEGAKRCPWSCWHLRSGCSCSIPPSQLRGGMEPLPIPREFLAGSGWGFARSVLGLKLFLFAPAAEMGKREKSCWKIPKDGWGSRHCTESAFAFLLGSGAEEKPHLSSS